MSRERLAGRDVSKKAADSRSSCAGFFFLFFLNGLCLQFMEVRRYFFLRLLSGWQKPAGGRPTTGRVNLFD